MGNTKTIQLSSPAYYAIEIPSKHSFATIDGKFVRDTHISDWSLDTSILVLKQFQNKNIVIGGLKNVKGKLKVKLFYKDILILILDFI